MSLRVGSLFSGIGGLELGLERAGMRVLWQVENSDFCRRVLEKHWPDVARYEDVHDVGAHNLEPVDLICGGFPCQPVSVAGKRKGQDDERWLWPEFARIIRELRPRYALMENVPGLLVRGFGDVLGDLATLGYDAEWGCVSAASVGAPHLRNRVFVVAHSRYTESSGRNEGAGCEETGQNPGHEVGHESAPCRGEVADTASQLRDGCDDNGGSGRGSVSESGNGGEETRSVGSWWSVESNVGRVAPRLPDTVDRLRALGNAVVPQVAEYIGHRIMSAV